MKVSRGTVTAPTERSSKDIYPFLRTLLFRLEPERAHVAALALLSMANRLGITGLLYPTKSAPREVLGITFPSPVGLAAGFDKNGISLRPLSALGFGFIEAGTITPRPQPGNPRPRIFRIPAQNALLNRLGFNNQGVDAFVSNVKRSGFGGVLGVNIGKNADTPIESAAEDYVRCLGKVYPFCRYIAVNVSSPNTPGLRSFQSRDSLRALLEAILEERERLAREHGVKRPLAVKIAPDLGEEELSAIISLLVELQIEAIIATNTTTDRTALAGTRWERESGGLSGRPLYRRALEVVRFLSRASSGKLTIIACGGIESGAAAREMLAAGASLCQIYTGFIYRGPKLVAEAVQACE